MNVTDARPSDPSPLIGTAFFVPLNWYVAFVTSSITIVSILPSTAAFLTSATAVFVSHFCGTGINSALSNFRISLGFIV